MQPAKGAVIVIGGVVGQELSCAFNYTGFNGLPVAMSGASLSFDIRLPDTPDEPYLLGTVTTGDTLPNISLVLSAQETASLGEGEFAGLLVAAGVTIVMKVLLGHPGSVMFTPALLSNGSLILSPAVFNLTE